jgi:hypothetical protein
MKILHIYYRLWMWIDIEWFMDSFISALWEAMARNRVIICKRSRTSILRPPGPWTQDRDIPLFSATERKYFGLWSDCGRIWRNEECCLPVTGPHQDRQVRSDYYTNTQLKNVKLHSVQHRKNSSCDSSLGTKASVWAAEVDTFPCSHRSQEEVKFFQRSCFNSIREPARNGVSPSYTETVLQQHVCPLPLSSLTTNVDGKVAAHLDKAMSQTLTSLKDRPPSF